jgi:uncharacterized protein (TIGR02302 family)
MNDDTHIKLQRRISMQRLGMIWERVWSALHWPLIAAGLIVVVLTSGLYQAIPADLRILALVAMALGLIVSFKDILKLSLPTDLAAMRRMEEAAAIKHRVLSAKDDGIVQELQSDETRTLWQEHKRRELAKLDTVPVSPPRSGWRSFDPRALRVPVLLAALVSVLLGPGLYPPQVSDALPVAGGTQGPVLSIDAWLKPPAYTGKAPMLLTSPAMKEKFATGAEVLVPENAAFTLRVNGAGNPRIEFHALGGAISDQSLISDIVPKTKSSETGFTAEAKLSRPAVIRVMDGETTLAEWPISVVPDQPPTVTFPKSHQTETGGGLTLHWEVKDDYGVRSVKSDISLADEQADGIGFASDGPFLYEPPEFPVVLKRSNAKSETGKSTHDLTAHPWAGLNVTLALTAKDGGGNVTDSAPVTLTLPERIFTRVLAKALIEQRKRLVIDPDKASDVATLFDTLLMYPAGLIDRSALHIRLAAISSHLANSADNEDIKTAVADLWQLALDVEDGSLADAKAELRDLKKQLEEAIRNGASEEEIAKLMDKMREAMKRYMDAMRKEAEKNKQAGRPPQSNDENSMSVTREDLERMMDMIEKLNKQGQQEQAQALLDQLDRMLQNMQPGQNQQQAGEGNQMGEMLDQLQEMMRQQQRLMDDTQRMQPGEGQPGQEGEGQDGQMGENGQGQEGQGRQPGSRGSGGLSQRQGALGDMLDELMGELGPNAPGELGDAGREMRGAEGSLGSEDRESALEQQGNALEQLRKGAGELRRQMQQQGQGQARSRGREGRGAGDDDPLGRPRATREEDRGPNEDMVPNELAAKRAREILEQLRSRANEQGLTEQERGYIDRLLRGLY